MLVTQALVEGGWVKSYNTACMLVQGKRVVVNGVVVTSVLCRVSVNDSIVIKE